MVSNLKLCSALMNVMDVGDPGAVDVAVHGCESGQALLVRHKLRKLLQQKKQVVKHHLESSRDAVGKEWLDCISHEDLKSPPKDRTKEQIVLLPLDDKNSRGRFFFKEEIATWLNHSPKHPYDGSYSPKQCLCLSRSRFDEYVNAGGTEAWNTNNKNTNNNSGLLFNGENEGAQILSVKDLKEQAPENWRCELTGADLRSDHTEKGIILVCKQWKFDSSDRWIPTVGKFYFEGFEAENYLNGQVRTMDDQVDYICLTRGRFQEYVDKGGHATWTESNDARLLPFVSGSGTLVHLKAAFVWKATQPDGYIFPGTTTRFFSYIDFRDKDQILEYFYSARYKIEYKNEYGKVISDFNFLYEVEPTGNNFLCHLWEMCSKYVRVEKKSDESDGQSFDLKWLTCGAWNLKLESRHPVPVKEIELTPWQAINKDINAIKEDTIYPFVYATKYLFFG